MDRIRGKISLKGDYSGRRDADIQFRFRFCDDGVYYYLVEQVGIWRLAHRGHFEIRTAAPLQTGASETQVVRLAPAVVDIDPGERDVYAMLDERALPSKKTEDYLLSGYHYSHAVNPNTRIYSYSFSIPDRHGFGTEWALEPDPS